METKLLEFVSGLHMGTVLFILACVACIVAIALPKAWWQGMVSAIGSAFKWRPGNVLAAQAKPVPLTSLLSAYAGYATDETLDDKRQRQLLRATAALIELDCSPEAANGNP